MAVVLGPTSLSIRIHSQCGASADGGKLNFGSFYIEGSHFPTGEHRIYRNSRASFDRVKPFHNLGNQNGWGAWEIALRYSQLDLNDQLINGGKLRDLTVGLNWYLNPTTRMMWNYVPVLESSARAAFGGPPNARQDAPPACAPSTREVASRSGLATGNSAR